MSARDLLTRLLDYIEEQAKDIDPRAFRLSSAKGFVKRRADLAGLLATVPLVSARRGQPPAAPQGCCSDRGGL